MTKKIDAIKIELTNNLPAVFFETDLREALNNIQDSWGFSDSTKYKVQNSATKIKVEWSRKPHLSLMTFVEDLEPLEVILGLCGSDTKYYVSHFSALYWNELVEQRPRTYYLCREVQSHKAIHTNKYNPDLVKQAFMKSPRHTTHSLKIKNLEAYIIEKQNLKHVGLLTKQINVGDRKVEFKLTGIERTLIDSIISPHYAGGILTVINSFLTAKINIRDLYMVYEKYQPFYPYWQSIGLILEKTKGASIGGDWLSYFNQSHMKEFYLDRKFRSDWSFSEKWKVYYPSGVFSD